MNNKLSMGCSVELPVCDKCNCENYLYTKTIQKSQEWFPRGNDEEMRFDYLSLDKDGKFSVAYTIRKKSVNKKCNV